MTETDRRPKEIRARKASGILEIVWDDDIQSALPFALLRAHCRCTECRSAAIRSGRASIPVSGDVAVTDIRPVGNYALQLVFDDGHDRGIFPFQYLRELHALPPAGTV